MTVCSNGKLVRELPGRFTSDGAPITFKTLSEDNWDNGRKVYNLLLAAEVLTAYEITTKKPAGPIIFKMPDNGFRKHRAADSEIFIHATTRINESG